MLPRTDGLTEPGIVRDGQQEVGVRPEVIPHLLAEDDLIADGRGQLEAVGRELRLHVGTAAERGHRQIEERGQRTQNRLQRHELAKRHQMVFIVAIRGVVVIRAVFAQRNDGVIGVVAVLLVQARVDDAGNQRRVLRPQQIVHRA